MADLNEIVAILEQIRDDTVPGLTQAVNDLSQATTNAGDASRDAAGGARESAAAASELSDSMRELSDATEDAEQSTNSFSGGLSKMGKGMKGVVGGIGQLGGALAALDPMAPARDIMQLTQDMRRNSGMSKELAQNIGTTTDQLRIFGVDAQEAAAATKALYEETTVFSQMSSEMQSNLVKEAALMAEVGVSNADYAKGIEVSMKAMGMSSDQAVDNLRQLRATAIDLGVPISTLTRDFGNNANMLAKLGDNGVQAFGELARISKVTGLEMNKLLAVTDKFDTFEGAAEAAGSLNAALGGNFVDSMSLMMETDPAERFKMIRDAVDDAGVAFEDMGYFQKKMMADAAGFSDVGEFAKAMSGDISALAGEMGKTDASVEAAQKEAFTVRTPQEIAEQMANALKPAFGEVANTLADAGEQFATKMLPATEALNQASISMTQSATGKMDTGIMAFILGLITYLPIIITNFGKFGAIASSVGTIISGAFSVIGGLFSGIVTVLTSKITLVIAAVVGLVGAFVGVYKKFDDIKALFAGGEIMEGIKLFFSSAIAGFVATFAKIAATIAEALGFDAPWIQEFKAIFEPGNFDALVDKFVGVFSNMKAKLKRIFIEIPGEFIGSIVDSIVGLPKRLYDGAVEGAKGLYNGFKEFFGIASPSRLMMDMIGGPLIDGILNPFTKIGEMLDGMNLLETMIQPFLDFPTKLKELMISALELIPEPIKNLITGEGGVIETAGDLAGMAADKAGAVFDAVSGAFDDEDKEPQLITISLNMDGREFDKKIIKVVGGIARDATGV